MRVLTNLNNRYLTSFSGGGGGGAWKIAGENKGTYNFCILAMRHVKIARTSAGDAVVRTLRFLSCNLAAKTAPPGSDSDTSDIDSGKQSSGKTLVNCSTRAFLGCKQNLNPISK